jgi:hypothetical protein
VWSVAVICMGRGGSECAAAREPQAAWERASLLDDTAAVKTAAEGESATAAGVRSPHQRMRPAIAGVTAASLAMLLLLVMQPAAAAANPEKGERQRAATATAAFVDFTVSGHSSGGSMASQHFFAFSDIVLGIGHLQAAPYACSRLSGPWQSACATEASVIEMGAVAEVAAASGQIAPLENLRTRPVWVFAGGQDSIVRPVVVQRAYELYSLFSSSTTQHVVSSAQHAYVTNTLDGCPTRGCNSCDTLAAPFLNDCDYDMAGVMLRHLYAPRELTPPTTGSFNASNIMDIEQSQFFPAGLSAQELGMNERAFAYVPAGCWLEPEQCALHVMYHGCGSSVSDPRIGESILRYWG